MDSKKYEVILGVLTDELERKDTDILILKYDLSELKRKLEAAEQELAQFKGKEGNDE